MRRVVLAGGLGIVCAAGIAFSGITRSEARTEAAHIPAVLSAKGLDPRAGEASPEGRLLIGRGRDYVPIVADPQELATRLANSMAQRRRAGWQIVEAMLQPQRLTIDGVNYEVPLWHTWYEGMNDVNPEIAHRIEMFIAELSACRSDPGCTRSRAEIAREVVAASPQKNLVRSLVPGNFDQLLAQFRDPTANPDALGRGFTLFSPSFVEHMLTEAEGVDRCAADIAWNVPPPSSEQFSPCISEFPRSAVMVKTQWERLDADNPRAPAHDTSATAVRQVIRNGSWPAAPHRPATPRSMYTVETTTGERYGLVAIHFSTKDIREWTWVSLWWSPEPNGDFGEDRPSAITAFNGGVWTNYKMCVTTAFEEGDAAPWSGFAGQPQLASALRAAHEETSRQAAPPPYEGVTSWCSNPNLESHTGNGRTNCIGCHQYAFTLNPATSRPASFSDTYNPAFAAQYPQFGRSRRRSNFPAEFAWSFPMEFRGEIRRARQRHGFEW